MRLLLAVVTLLAFCAAALAQPTKEEVFTRLQELLKRAEGEKYEDGIFNEKTTLTQQDFTEATITQRTKFKSGSTKLDMIKRYKNIRWTSMSNFYIFPINGSSKVQRLQIRFKEDFTSEYFSFNESEDDNPSNTSIMDLVVLSKDEQEVDKYMNRLGYLMQEARKKEANTKTEPAPKNAEPAPVKKEPVTEVKNQPETLKFLTEAQLKNIVANPKRPAVISFWFRQCGPCVRLLQEIYPLFASYSSEVDFYIIDVREKDGSGIKGIHSFNANYSLAYPTDIFYYLENGWNAPVLKQVNKDWNGSGVPFTMVLKDGKNIAVKTADDLRKALE